MNDAQEYHFTVVKNQQSLIEALAEHTSLSKNLLKEALQRGAVWLKQPNIKKVERFRRAKKVLATGTQVFLYYSPQVLATEIEAPQLISDQIDFSVWYKPKGVLCQGSKWADHTTIHRWIETEYHFSEGLRKAAIVHRLDRATDGLMLIAHNKKAAKQLTKAFENRTLSKIYQAWVLGNFPQQPQTYDSDLDGKPALTIAECLRHDAEQNRSLLQVTLHTGRKHQIRKHLSAAGYPIIGDRLYNLTTSDHQQDLQLTATRIELDVDGETHCFELPPNLLLS